MAAPRHALEAWSQYLAARAAVAALTSFEVQANYPLAQTIGRIAYRLDRRHRRRLLANIGFCFPELDQRGRVALAQRSFEHLFKLVLEICYTPRLITPDSWHRRISLGTIGPALDPLIAGKPVLLVTGHLGNWEILGYLLAMLGFEVHALARPIDNPLVNDWLLGIRERHGLHIITKWNATDRMVDVIARGGALGFIADQNAGDRGLFVPFFGRLASTYKSIGLLAMRHEVPIVCGYAHRTERGYHYELGTVDVIRPEDWSAQPDPLYYITARYIRAIEQMVRRRPEQYLWMHRRWKSRPQWERQGKPMPAGLRAKLEALPWMDDATMVRLQQPAAGEV